MDESEKLNLIGSLGDIQGTFLKQQALTTSIIKNDLETLGKEEATRAAWVAHLARVMCIKLNTSKIAQINPDQDLDSGNELEIMSDVHNEDIVVPEAFTKFALEHSPSEAYNELLKKCVDEIEPFGSLPPSQSFAECGHSSAEGDDKTNP